MLDANLSRYSSIHSIASPKAVVLVLTRSYISVASPHIKNKRLCCPKARNMRGNAHTQTRPQSDPGYGLEICAYYSGAGGSESIILQNERTVRPYSNKNRGTAAC